MASKPFILGERSLGFLAGVHPTLVAVFERAITITTVDFGFTEPQVRTFTRQKELVARGVSQTLKSNHIAHADFTGHTKNLYGHAGDAVPWIDGKFVWDWGALYNVAAAIAEAARDLDVLDQMCWGGVWDQWMTEYAGNQATAATMRQAEATYCVRHPGKDFVDGPHFQFAVKG